MKGALIPGGFLHKKCNLHDVIVKDGKDMSKRIDVRAKLLF